MDPASASSISPPGHSYKALDIKASDIAGDLYATTYDKPGAQLRYNGTEGLMDTYYDDIVNPVYNFDSPYLMQNGTLRHETEQRVLPVLEQIPYRDGVVPFLGNVQKAHQGNYGSRDMNYMLGYDYNAYHMNNGYNNLGSPGMQQFAHVPKMAMYPPHENRTPLMSCDMNASSHKVPEVSQDATPKTEERSESNHSTAPSVISESSPQFHGMSGPCSNDYRPNIANTPTYMPVNNTILPVSMTPVHNFNEEYMMYNVRHEEGDDCYNRTYMENSPINASKPVVSWYNTMKENFYDPRMQNHRQELTAVVTPRRVSVMHQTYNPHQNPYPGNMLYCTNNWEPKAYMYDHEVRGTFPTISKSPACYDNGTEYTPNKSDSYTESGSTINELRTQPSKENYNMTQIGSNYENAVEQSPISDYFRKQGNNHSELPNGRPISDEYGKELLDSRGCVGENMGTDLCMESLKSLNRNNIDFLRMSESVWQALRSTGMFKLGNKGRAILKSKISKQLKMNPHLRMRALGISGVRRATTRQLFQLAQICGIKSHLK
ncbi:uncharacterized protein BBOV_IV004870 [Babesia bovis T2Bo]|uniref:Uncharacterized protein n=1 Tax=Babesia bovis TaxID=5865 RepID=A7AQM9_BABBO|nr:uncharacterized protein BBOV_IV004870 [Babesia bovis T2Bo]EDO06848.1 hypothetical protein BBOV_IV004870 [Babesia bovis T2Bo]|eukprot:XP_001610416.1 hypothetical protein [Babesia bovis T2Bo]